MKKRDLGVELCLAVIEPNTDEVERLLAEGADVNTIGPKSYTQICYSTPLWLAVHNAGKEISTSWMDLHAAVREILPIPERDHSEKRNKFVEIARKLIGAGADLETLSFGGTPLRIAVCGKDAALVNLLLSNGANPNAETFSPISKRVAKDRRKGPLGLMGYYNTVLHEAVEKNSLDIVKALLNAGANPTRTDHEDKTPLDIAIEKNHTEIAEILSKAIAKD